MPSVHQKSTPARATLVLLALIAAFLVAMAARPAAGLAEPGEEPQPQLAFEPESYEFGLQPVNSGSSQANLQLRNVGTEAVNVDSVEISGAGSDSFWTNSNCFGMTLQPNGTCFVQVYFSPREMTEYAVQLRASAGPHSFTADLTGTGGRAVFAPAFNPTDFGVAAVGSAGTTREIAVSNAGNVPGGVFIAVVSGGAVGSFQLLDENCTGRLLSPAATCTLQVRFRPLSEGVKTAMLSLFGEADGGTQIVLTGVGAAPEPAPGVSSGPAARDGVAANATAPAAVARHRPKLRKRRPRIHRGHRRHRRAGLAAARRIAIAG